MMASKVDLPEPLGPQRAKTSPSWTSTSATRSSKARSPGADWCANTRSRACSRILALVGTDDMTGHLSGGTDFSKLRLVRKTTILAHVTAGMKLAPRNFGRIRRRLAGNRQDAAPP